MESSEAKPKVHSLRRDSGCERKVNIIHEITKYRTRTVSNEHILCSAFLDAAAGLPYLLKPIYLFMQLYYH